MNKTANDKSSLAPLSDELIESGVDLSPYMKAARAVPAAFSAGRVRKAGQGQRKIPAGRIERRRKTPPSPLPGNVIDLVSVLQESLQRHGRSRAKRAAWAELLAEAAALKERFSQFENLLQRVTEASLPRTKADVARR